MSTSRPKRTTEAPREGDWRPNPGPQERFLATTASEALYGGAAGGGKSAALVAMPTRWVHDGRFNALILRRDTTQLKNLWRKASDLYPKAFPGAKPNNGDLIWTFPSGAKIWFTHCQHETDIARFDGDEYNFIGFDELTHFTREMFVKITARLRGPADLPKIARATTNPGGEGHEWVFERWGPWLNPESPVRAEFSKKLWYLPTADGERWCGKDDTTTIEINGKPTVVPARSRTFIPASVSDNPYIGADYVGQLMELDAVRQAQLLSGDWLIKPSPGLYFKRDWFEIVDAAPAQALRVRYWDRAGTKENRDLRTGKALNDPDWTVGLKLARTAAGEMFVEDVVRFRGDPGEVQRVILQTAKLDNQGGAVCHVGLEQDPGQAGVFEIATYVKALFGYQVHAYRPTGDKVTRAGPASAQAKAKNIKLLKGAWNKAFLEELEAFPSKAHDDQVDALSGAVSALAFPTQQPRRDLSNLLPR